MGNGSEAPCILDLDNRLKYMVGFMLWLLYVLRRSV